MSVFVIGQGIGRIVLLPASPRNKIGSFRYSHRFKEESSAPAGLSKRAGKNGINHRPFPTKQSMKLPSSTGNRQGKQRKKQPNTAGIPCGIAKQRKPPTGEKHAVGGTEKRVLQVGGTVVIAVVTAVFIAAGIRLGRFSRFGGRIGLIMGLLEVQRIN